MVQSEEVQKDRIRSRDLLAESKDGKDMVIENAQEGMTTDERVWRE